MYTKNALSDFSSLSVICAVDKFVKSVDAMNETIMVPSRLLDFESKTMDEEVPVLLRGNHDQYSFFNRLNGLKHELLWGVSATDDDDNEETDRVVHNPTWFVQSINGKISEEETRVEKGHLRKVSSVSTVSSGISEQESERLSEAGDSGVDTLEPDINEVTSALKLHLNGLQECLNQLTASAHYIKDKYKKEFSA